eukprot:756241-Rhodomonas_salina.2
MAVPGDALFVPSGSMGLRGCYAVPGTDVAYGATRRLKEQRPDLYAVAQNVAGTGNASAWRMGSAERGAEPASGAGLVTAEEHIEQLLADRCEIKAETARAPCTLYRSEALMSLIVRGAARPLGNVRG